MSASTAAAVDDSMAEDDVLDAGEIEADDEVALDAAREARNDTILAPVYRKVTPSDLVSGAFLVCLLQACACLLACLLACRFVPRHSTHLLLLPCVVCFLLCVC